MPTKNPAPPWVHIIAKDMEATGLPNTATLKSIWMQTAPEDTRELSGFGKAAINLNAIQSIDWTDDVIKRFLTTYFHEIGKRKLTMERWQDDKDRLSFEDMCRRLINNHEFRISTDHGFQLPSGHFQAVASMVSDRQKIKNSIDSIAEAIHSGKGSLAASQIFSLMETIMKARHPEEPFFRGKARLPDKVKKSVSLLPLVDANLVLAQSVADIPCAYSQYMDRIGFLRNKHGVHGTESFDEDVYSPAILKSLAMFAVGFFYLHFPE